MLAVEALLSRFGGTRKGKYLLGVDTASQEDEFANVGFFEPFPGSCRRRALNRVRDVNTAVNQHLTGMLVTKASPRSTATCDCWRCFSSAKTGDPGMTLLSLDGSEDANNLAGNAVDRSGEKEESAYRPAESWTG